jgi:hypothetical protein
MAIVYFHFSINPWKNVVSFYLYLKRINDTQQCFLDDTSNKLSICIFQIAYFNFKWESCMGCMPLAPSS